MDRVSSPARRFQIEPLEERVAPANSLLSLDVALNVEISGEVQHVHVKMKNVAIVVQDNIFQVAVNSTNVIAVIA